MILAAVFAMSLTLGSVGDLGRPAPSWGRLESGMTPERVFETVGAPMLRNAARGHELWTYDGGGCAQFHGGRLIAWTAPAKPAVAAVASRGTGAGF